MKKIICSLVVALLSFNAIAQNNNRTLLTIGNEEVSVDDFLSIYNKNRTVGEDLDPKTLDEYVDLFVKFKLKVKEAEALGMDTVPSFVKELAGYRKQLANPYLVDNEAGEQLVVEAYERLKQEVKASHILITIAADASSSDTLKAYNKILKLRTEIVKGADFATYAKQYSQDPSAKENAGNLGYFSAMYMVYPFENAAYATNVGDVSEIVRTRFGYHILKVNDKRESRGEVRTAHIMVKFPKGSGENSAQELTLIQQKVNEIYTKLISENADFDEMAKQYSDDKNNASKGGVLPWFGTNRMVESFENAAFSLANIGDISVPTETPYGWHIIKLVDKKGLGSFEEEKAELKKKVEKDSRAQVKRTSLVNKLKKEYNYKEYKSAVNELKKIVNTDFIAGKWSLENNSNKLTKTVITIGEAKFVQADFAAYLMKSVRKMKSKVQISTLVDDTFASWSEDRVIAYENENLENKYNEFRLLMQEYRDGILLYELTDKKIWSKAVKDTTGLKAFYQANKQNYMWDTRVDAKVVNCQNENIACKVYNKLRKGKTDLSKLQAKVNKKSSLNMDVKEGLYLKGDNLYVDQVEWVVGVSDLIDDNENVKVVYIKEVIEPQVKALSEAKGLITSDYQDALEQAWLAELSAKYKVEINSYVLDLVKTNRLSELDVVEVPKTPSYKGHFVRAFGKARRSLGSSKDIIFEWYGNLYTTELKRD
jgi:peptidyl-prolyl cis-trans isomerase SurA